MSIKPRDMVVTFDNVEDIDRITSLFTHYHKAADGGSLSAPPPVIRMFGGSYVITKIENEKEVVGFNHMLHLTPARDAIKTQSVLIVTLRRQ